MNGFRGFVSERFSAFDPELKITAARGKTFDPGQDERFGYIRRMPEIERITESVEDNVLIRYRDRQVPAILKGVSDNFNQPIPLWDGEFRLRSEGSAPINPGIGVASILGLNAGATSPLEIYAPKRRATSVNPANPMAAFNVQYTYVSGVFLVKQALYDDEYAIVSLDLARSLFDYETEVGAWELRIREEAHISSVQAEIRRLLGEDYLVKNRYEQQETAFRMISIEKWFAFMMLCFILLIAAFNIIGSLSMLMVDKQKDIRTLRNLGANNRLISRIFLFEGWLISVVGAVAGTVLGLLLCFGQQRFGWIKLGRAGEFAVSAYPVEVQPVDLALIVAAVLMVGFLAVIYPVRYLSRKWL
jgi:lipoprotein-releasing system permease protein/zinc transport system substrate-binding protein